MQEPDFFKIDRLFVPVNTTAFSWFESGEKKWELRKKTKRFNEKHITSGRLVEVRRGYTHKMQAIWSVIDQVIQGENLREVFRLIDYREIIPSAKSEQEAVSISSSFFDSEKGPYIAFKLEPIRFSLKLNKRFSLATKSGRKKSTIRRGKRDIPRGCAIFDTGEELIPISITDVFSKKFGQLQEADALSDGFKNLEELRSELLKFYPELVDDSIVSVITFDIPWAKTNCEPPKC